MSEFLTPYQMSKVLEGVIPANRIARPNFLQSFFADVATHDRETVNFDKEFQTKNTPAMYVAPNVDAPLIALQGYGTMEMGFAYVKEGLTSPDYEEINFRQLGQQFGQVDIWANWVANIRKKLAITEFNFENLFELNASNLIITGKHTASSALHPTVVYDFRRPVATTDAQYLAGFVSEIDLSTLNGNGGVGKRAWNSTGGTKAPTPVEDIRKMVQTTLRRSSVSAVIISSNAYPYLEADINTNYKDAADLTQIVEGRVSRIVMPVVENYQDLLYRRSLTFGGVTVDIYTYDAIYHTRDANATETKFFPNNYVAVLPDRNLGIKRYGRIMHPDAQYAPMQRYINTWKDVKTGKQESEIHCNYLMGHKDIESVVCWRVMA